MITMTKFELMLENYSNKITRKYTEEYVIEVSRNLTPELAKRNLMKWLENMRKFIVEAKGFGLTSGWIEETEDEVVNEIIPALDSGDDQRAAEAYFALSAINDLVEYGQNIIDHPSHFINIA